MKIAQFIIPLKLFFIILFSMCFLKSFSQNFIKTKDFKIVIPRFNEDSVASFSSQYPVKQGFVSNIKISKSSFELRRYVYYQAEFTGILDIINCNNDTIHSIRYTWRPTKNKDIFFNSNYKYWTELNDHSGEFLFVKKSNTILTINNTWKSFLSDLINNHLYELPNEKVMAKEIQLDGLTKSGFSHGKVVYELKVDSKFRNVAYMNEYNDGIINNSNYKSLVNINNIFVKLFSE